MFVVSCENSLISLCSESTLGTSEPESLGWLLKSSSPCGGVLERGAAMACPVSGVTLSRILKHGKRGGANS